MKNTIKTNGINCLVYFFLFFILFACHKDEVKLASDTGAVPVTLSTAVSKIQTRVDGSSFSDEDQIGLFLLEQPNTLTGNRHADNMKFVCNGTEWIPDHQVFFPKDGGRSDFIAYYPYQASGLPAGVSSLGCEVKQDQSVQGNYSLSDFLVAFINDVEPIEDAVPLNFKHKLTALEFVIDPGTAYTSAEELLNAHPLIMIKNVCTSAEYDFLTGVFTKATKNSDIIPAGEFTIKDNKLIGKRAVIVPQTILAGQVLIELLVGAKNYSFTLGEEYNYLSATKEICTLTLRAFVPADIPGRITASVSDWDNTGEQTGDLNENENSESVVPGYYSVNIPDFSESSVYKAMNGNVQVAEICREYLKSTGIDNQAVVAYPVKEGKTDQAKGVVLRVLDGNAGTSLTAFVHGGSVSWDRSSGLFTYTMGTSAPLASVWVDAKGNMGQRHSSVARLTQRCPQSVAF